MRVEQLVYDFAALTLPGISAVPRPEDINNRGDIVGYYGDARGEHGFLLRDGKVTTLDVPGASSTTASGINDAGDIVGTYGIWTNDDSSSHGFLYRDGVFTTLDIPGADGTALNGINNAGLIVAFTSASETGPSGGFLYENGSFTKITVPGIPDAFLVPEGINDHGVIVGESGNQGFVLEAGRLALIDNPYTPYFVRPLDINDEGLVAGTLAPVERASQGFLYRDGAITLLGPLLPYDGPPSGGLHGVNDAGEIVGSDFSGGSEREFAFLATPAAPVSHAAEVAREALAAAMAAGAAAIDRLLDQPVPSSPADWEAWAAHVAAIAAAWEQWFA